jgi:hypothetical protein
MHLPKEMNMKLTSVKKLLVAFVGTIFFSSLGVHGTASAQVPFVEGIDVTAPPWNCREEFVDWMGAGGGYFMTICDSWNFTPPPTDLGPPPPDGSGFGGDLSVFFGPNISRNSQLRLLIFPRLPGEILRVFGTASSNVA